MNDKEKKNILFWAGSIASRILKKCQFNNCNCDSIFWISPFSQKALDLL